MSTAPNVSRRTVLLGSVGAVAFTGCSFTDPRVSGLPQPAPTPTPRPAVTIDLAGVLNTEGMLAATLQATKAPGASALADAHQQHLASLAKRWELSAPSPGAAKDTATAFSLAAKDHRRAAIASTGRIGLSVAMLAAFSTTEPLVLTRAKDAVITQDLANVAPASDVTALQQLLSQVHAAWWGYLTAMGPFTLASDARDLLEVREFALRTLRDQLSDILVRRKAEVPPAAVAYQIDKPATPAAAVALTGGIEQRLLPFCGAAVLADAGGSATDRAVLIDALIASTHRLVSTGAPLALWPGQPS